MVRPRKRKTGKNSQDIFAPTRSATRVQGRRPGRPPIHEEAWTKVTVVLFNRQIVFLDRNPSLVAADTVRSDHRGGAVGAVAHLIDRGHRRIAYLGDRTVISTARDRHAGYLEALRAAGIGVSDELIRQDLSTSEQAAYETQAVLELPEPPTALFTSQNLVTIGALRALRAAGLRSRIAHVGFDDVLLGDLLEPSLTVVAQDPRELGHLAAMRLFARIDGDRSPAQAVVVPTRLIVRGSGELPPT